jgi:UDPglucose 6-dehydrogenase
MQVAIIGTGYVGLVAAACLAEMGHHVICADREHEKIARLQNGEVPIHEEFLEELLERHLGSRLTFTADLETAVRPAKIVFIAVGTPAGDDGSADLSHVETVARELAQHLSQYKVIVEKSTVPVFTGERIAEALLLNGADPENFDVASNPEFLREGTGVADFLYPDRIVIGSGSERAARLLGELYAPLTEEYYNARKDAIPQPDDTRTPARILFTSVKSAELIKHASNAFLATKISFANAVANLCEEVGADVKEVMEGIGADGRISPRFLKPGIGYGGSCFPKDLSAFRALAADSGYDFPLLDEVKRINEAQRVRFLRKVRRALWNLKNKRLGVWGLAYKGGTDDVRESPAVAICASLLAEGCRLVAYDPAAMERAAEVLAHPSLEFAGGALDAAQGADALLVLTDWEEFTTLDMKEVAQVMRYPILIDGRNLFDPAELAAAGFYYCSIGRADVQPPLYQYRKAG